MKKLKIHHISDTHGYHELLQVDTSCNMIIHSGDASNSRNPIINEPEMRKFLEWYSNLPIKYKIFSAGNHDTSIESRLITKEEIEEMGIIYLENDYVTIEGFKIFGSPHTPSFGNWAFMKARHNLDDVWKLVDDDVDIFICHGPCKTILDLSYTREGTLEFCGDESLRKHILGRIKPKLFLHGHLHSQEGIINTGTRKLSTHDTIFSNGSVCTDGKFGKLTSNGNIFEL